MTNSQTPLPAPSRSFSDNAPANPAVPALVAEPCREGDVALVYQREMER